MLAAVALNAFVAAFGGTWTCTLETPHGVRAPATTWTIAAAPHGPWTRITYAPGRGGGVAYIGYLPYEKVWVYQDFHDDGSYAANTSPGPERGDWTFEGAFVTAERMQHYAVRWRRDGATIRRSFGRLIGPSFRPLTTDVCRR
jgi:hypothetical protein